VIIMAYSVLLRLNTVSKEALANFVHTEFNSVGSETSVLASGLAQADFEARYQASIGKSKTFSVVGIYRNDKVQIAAIRVQGLETKTAYILLSLANGVTEKDAGLGTGNKEDLLVHIGGETEVWADGLTGTVEFFQTAEIAEVEQDEVRPEPLKRGWAQAALQTLDVGLRPLSADDKRRIGTWKPRQGDAAIQLDLTGWAADKNPESKTGVRWQGVKTRPDGTPLTIKKAVLVEKGRTEGKEGAFGRKVEGAKQYERKLMDVPVIGDVGDVWCAQMGRTDKTLIFEAVSIQFGEFVFPEHKSYQGPGKEKGNNFAQVTLSGVLFNINGVPKGARISGVYHVEVRVKRLRYQHGKDASKDHVRAVYTLRLTAHDRAPKATHRLYLAGARARHFVDGALTFQGPQQAKIVLEPIEQTTEATAK
jgi:hypothetical protein